MMAKPELTDAQIRELSTLSKEERHKKYPHLFDPVQSAGTFENRPFFDRINPTTPFNKKRFVPNEKAKILLEKYKQRTGKNLVVLPLSATLGQDQAKQSQQSGLQGLFRPRDLIGGSNDPKNRYVYLNPEEVTKDGVKSPGLFTLAHEAYHAYDPSLLNEPVRGKLPTGIQKMAGGLVDFLLSDITDFDKSGPFHSKKRIEEIESLPLSKKYKEAGKEDQFRYRKELDAQIGAAKDLKELGVKDESFRTPVNIFDYPRSYIRNRMNSLKDAAFKEAQGYDYESDTYADTGFQTVRGVQKKIPQLEQEYKKEATEYEDKQIKKIFPDYPGYENFSKN